MEKTQIIDIQIVKDLMEKLHMSDKQLAEKMGVTLPTVKRLLGGADQTHMRTIVLKKVSLALGVPPKQLMNKDHC